MTIYRLFSIFGAVLILTSGSCSKQKPDDGGKDTPDTPVTPPAPQGFQRYQKDFTLNSKTLREYVKYSVYLPADCN